MTLDLAKIDRGFPPRFYEDIYVWAVVDVDTFEVLHVDVSAGRSSLYVFLFLREVWMYCRGQPGYWLTPASGTIGRLTMLFRHRLPHYSTRDSTESWLIAFVTLHNAIFQS